MKKLLILIVFSSLVINASSQMDSKRYQKLMSGTNKSKFENMAKEYQKNAKSNFEKFSKSTEKMKDKYKVKGTKEEMIAIINQEKVIFIKGLINIQEGILKVVTLDDLFKTMITIKTHNKGNGFTNIQNKKYIENIKKKKERKETLSIYRYSRNLSLKIIEIEKCYLNAIDPLSLDNCTEKFEKFRDSEKIKRFIKKYMDN